jgi:hypothetical protein
VAPARVVEGQDHVEDDDLTDWERLQVAAMAQILKTGKATLNGFDFQVHIDYTDR